MSKQGTGRKVAVRLYMEGRLVENAFASVHVEGGVNTPSQAQLELVPTDTIKHVLPGTWVHVFTTDPFDPAPAGDLSDFKLLFEGVMVGRGFSRTESGRNFVITCADASVYWTTAKQYWLNVADANGGLVDQLAVQTSGGYGRFAQIGVEGTYGYMVSKLAFADKDKPEERFMDTLIAVLDDIGNVNPFYTNVRNRFRIMDRIIRGPAGKTDQLFQLALMGDFLEGLAGRVSGQTDLVEVVNQLLGAIFHEWVSTPAPPYIKTRIFDRDSYGNVKRNRTKVLDRGPRGRDTVSLYDVQTAQDAVIGSIFFKPHIYTISPPKCNVLFPNMYEGFSFSESFLGQTTRLSMKPQLPLVGAAATQGLLLQRPTELEIFTAMVRDPRRSSAGARTPDGQFADGAGQTPVFTDYDWTTNEERIRGIVYNFINLAPASSTLTLADPGKRTPAGAREGGIPKYLQNVASYEWYKSKFVSRQTELKGPYNMRPIPGFSLLALDDSPANQNLVCYLERIAHTIVASGQATTNYQISYARLLDEIDLNRPRFQGGTNAQGELNFDLVRDANGNYDFSQLFEGNNQPPIPEWFDESWRNVHDLDIRFRQWFGEACGVVQSVLFQNPGDKPSDVAIETAAEVIQAESGDVADLENVGDALRRFKSDTAAFEAILEKNEAISLQEVANELNSQFRRARYQGKEFELTSVFTNRSFTKIDEAFRFVGASPRDLADPPKNQNDPRFLFTKQPANARTIDYRTTKLDRFVGDTSPGSGYSGSPEAAVQAQPVDAISGADRAAQPTNRMSGAFPVFETQVHTGNEATNSVTREAARTTQREPSDWPRYDGRPVMFDFEFRLWQQSLRDAGFAPTGEKLDANAVSADYVVEDPRGNVVRPKTAQEQADAAIARTTQRAAVGAATSILQATGRVSPKAIKSPTPAQQAPTGAGLEQGQRMPLTQPLSEKQVVDIRRSIIDAYCDELARTRGFRG